MTGSTTMAASSPRMATPALASANSGTMRNATHGWSVCSRRSIGAWACSVGVLQLPQGLVMLLGAGVLAATVRLEAVDDARAPSPRRLGASRRTRAGIVDASRTPATVAWTPDWSTASHSTDAQQRRRRSGGAPPAVGSQQQRRRARGRRQSITRSRSSGVEDGDDQHREQVVDDGERGQEDLQAQRDARAEQRQHAEREGDVGGHRDAPADEPAPPPPTMAGR